MPWLRHKPCRWEVKTREYNVESLPYDLSMLDQVSDSYEKGIG